MTEEEDIYEQIQEKISQVKSEQPENLPKYLAFSLGDSLSQQKPKLYRRVKRRDKDKYSAKKQNLGSLNKRDLLEVPNRQNIIVVRPLVFE